MANKWFTKVVVAGLLANMAPVQAEQGRWVVRGLANNDQAAPLIETANVASRPAQGFNQPLDLVALDNFAFSMAYFVNDVFSVELLAARPIPQRVAVSGLGSAGSLIQLPPTLTVRYHLPTEKTWKPYVGVGVNWASDIDGADIGGQAEVDLRGTTGYAFQAGVYFELSEKWVVNFETRVSDIDLPVRVAGNPVGRSNINPVMTALKLGYQF